MTDAVLGIDVSKNTFDTNLGAGTKARSKSFANSPDGWHHLICSSLYLILQTASFWRWPGHCRWWSGSDHFFPRNRDGVKECLQRRLAEAPAALMRSLLVVAFDP